MLRESGRLKVYVSASLLFFTTAFVVLGNTYTTAVFLSTYPASWLSYFFMGQAFFSSFAAAILGPILSKRQSRFTNNVTYMLCLLIFVAYYLLQSRHIYSLNFIFCLLVVTMTLIFGVMSWNHVTSACSVREFKQIGRVANISGALGGAIVGISVFFLTTYHLSAIIFFVLISLIIFIALLSQPLKALKVTGQLKHKSSNPLRFPLFRSILIFVLLFSLLNTVTDFSFKIMLSHSYANNEMHIARYVGILRGVCSLGTLAIQLFLIRKMIEAFGIVSLWFILPALFIVVSLIVLLFPQLPELTALSGLWFMLYYSTINLGREYFLNVLPRPVARAAKFQLKALALPAGVFMGAVLGWLITLLPSFSTHLGFSIRLCAIIIIICCLFLLYDLRQVMREYKRTLKDAIRMQRFDIDLLSYSHGNEALGYEMVNASLISKHADDIRFGLSVVMESSAEIKSQYLSVLFARPESDIKIRLVKILMQQKDPEVTETLMKYFNKEKDDLVKSWLLQAIVKLRPEFAYQIAGDYLHAPFPRLACAAIEALLVSGSLDEVIDAMKVLQGMIYSKNPDEREAASKTLPRLSIGHASQVIQVLIADNHQQVSISAMYVALEMKDTSVIDLIISRLVLPHVGYHAMKILIRFGDVAIPPILAELPNAKHLKRVRLLNILTFSLLPDVDVSLLQLYLDSNDIQVKSEIARAFARYRLRSDFSVGVRLMIKKIILSEARLIGKLKKLVVMKISEELGVEVESRMRESKRRFLYFLAVFISKISVLNMIPTLLFVNKKKGFTEEQLSAFELLEYYCGDPVIKNSLRCLENEDKFTPIHVGTLVRKINDAWLSFIYDATTNELGGDVLDDVQKVFALRRCDIFKGLPGETLIAIAKATNLIEVEGGQAVFNEGDDSDGLYIVAQGSIKVSRKSQSIATINRGGVFGELGTFDGIPRVADACATTETLLLFVESDIFKSLINDNPEISMAIIRLMLRYIRKSELSGDGDCINVLSVEAQ